MPRSATDLPADARGAQRVVSLLAAGTDIVCALGQGQRLVGRSHECDHPPWIGELPACTRAAFDAELPSGAIDAEVRRRLAAGEPLYHVDAARIRALQPDLLIAQAHCAVCAVTPADVERASGGPLAVAVLALGAGSVAGIFQDVRSVACALGVAEAGDALVQQLAARMAAVTQRLAARRPPSVVVLEWIDPLFAFGNWGPELVAAAHGRPLIAKAGQYSRTVDWQQLREADPEFLVIAPCGYGLEHTRREMPTLTALPGWSQLQAVRRGQVAIADGHRYFNRSGVTIVDTVEILAEILHGERGAGRAWERAEIEQDCGHDKR